MNLLKSYYSEQLTEIVHQVKQYGIHPYVQRYVDLPDVSQLRLQLLYLFLKQQNLDEDLIAKYCVATTLIQWGLDSHEQVEPHSDKNLKNERTRQLRVLAGDYFSCGYYFILSELEDTDMIQSLASSIQSINELKIRLYSKGKENNVQADDYLSQLGAIDSALYTSFVSMFSSSAGQAWKETMQSMVLVERLLHEYRSFKWEHKKQGYLSLIGAQVNPEQAIHRLLTKADELLTTAKKQVSQFKNDKIRREILSLVTDYINELDLNPRPVAEEL